MFPSGYFGPNYFAVRFFPRRKVFQPPPLPVEGGGGGGRLDRADWREQDKFRNAELLTIRVLPEVATHVRVPSETAIPVVRPVFVRVTAEPAVFIEAERTISLSGVQPK